MIIKTTTSIYFNGENISLIKGRQVSSDSILVKKFPEYFEPAKIEILSEEPIESAKIEILSEEPIQESKTTKRRTRKK